MVAGMDEMRKTIKSLEADLKFERNQVQEWRNKYYVMESDRDKLRSWIINKFDWWVNLCSEKHSPCLKYLIKNTAEILGMKK